MDKISFLIDTNIFINLEDDKIIENSFAKFHQLCNENSSVIYIHPLSKEEIRKDHNQTRKDHTLSKIKKYSQIENPPSIEKQQLEQMFGDIKKTNDKVDCLLLYALYKHSVSFLVTEDIGIHKRSKKQNIKNRVLTINQANDMLCKLFPKRIEISLPKIENDYIYNIEFNDRIFDSLKYDYKNFEDWFKKCSQEQVKAWFVKNLENESKLESICIYKEAKNEDYRKYPIPEKSLKLATFKVDESYRGRKLGELMLKQAFLYSVKNNYKSCWMTVFPKHEILIDFIKDFGFIEIGKTDLDKQTGKKEIVFRKDFVKPKNYPKSGLDFHIKYSPFYDDRENIEKYIIPIKEKYHKILFPEYKSLFHIKKTHPLEEIQLSLFKMNFMENEISGNTIKKMYLCHAPTKQLKPNDLLFFYVSAPIKKICSIGIVESVFRSSKLNKVVSHIGKRSVYSFSEIKEMTKKNVLVIAFRFIKHLNKALSLKELKRQQIIKGPPQSIQKIKNYDQLKIYLQKNSN